MRRKNRFVPFVLGVVAGVILASCTSSHGSDVLSERKMAAVLYDYHMAQAVFRDMPRNEKYKRDFYFEYVFEKHGITEEEFENSLVWYTRHPDKLYDVYTNIDKKVNTKKRSVAAKLEKIENTSYSLEVGDSVELWYQEKNRIMNSSPYLNPVLFNIQVDSTFYNSDMIEWNLGLTFFGHAADSLRPYVYLSLSQAYGDSVSTKDIMTGEDGRYNISIQNDSVRSATSLFGSIIYQNPSDNDSLFVIVDNISMKRIHSEQSVPSDTTVTSLE